MLNTENALLSRVNGEAARRAGFDPNEILIASPQHFNDAAMMQRNDGLIPASQEPAEPALEEKEIYVSAGSACSSNKPQISDTLKAIGVERDLLSSTIRFSLSVFTTEEEIQYTIQALEEMVPMLRKYTRS